MSSARLAAGAPGCERAGDDDLFLSGRKKAGGAYVTVTGAVKKIDEYEKDALMEDGNRHSN